MIKNYFTIFILILFVLANISFATDVNSTLKSKAIDKQIVTDEMEAKMEAKIQENADLINSVISKKQKASLGKTLADGDTVGWTVRDFSMNTCMGRKVAFDPNTGNVHVVFTQWEPNAVDPYHEYYNFYDNSFGLWYGTQSIDPSLDATFSRSGRVMVGPNGEGIVSFHRHDASHQCYVAMDNAPGGYSFTSHVIADGRFASADYKDNGATWFSTNDADGDFVVDRFFNSTDGASTWSQTTNFITVPSGDAVANVELYPHFDPVTGDIGLMYANDNEPDDIGEAAWWAQSSDLGDSWNITQIYEEETLVGDVWYLIENFSQYMTIFDENGTLHFVFNGYGLMTDGTSPDSTLYFIMDVGYWNSNMSSTDEIINLVDSLHSRNQPVCDAMNGLPVSSGNNLGNAFPGIALGPNGVIAVIWEQAELAPGDTSLLVATDASGTPDPAQVYANDLYCAVSSDYGITWSAPFYIAGTPGKCDRSPSLAKDIEFDGTNYYIHYVYMYDPEPGQDLPNPPTDPAAWVYGKYDITSHLLPPGGIDTDNDIVNNFKLSQNYPNPFNPSTEIRFELSKTENVSLEVFNTIGEKVATLINGKVSAGEKTVTFNGANYSSGVYFYQLTAGDFVQTKKMLLVK